MKGASNHRELVEEGKRLEKAGDLPGAAAMYQKVVDEDGTNPDAVGRLLVIYRKEKEYSKELALIKSALTAFKQRDTERQEVWLSAHPKAAGAGKAILKQLGGSGATAFDDDPAVAGLLKRKAVVERRMGGKKTRKAVVKRIAKKTPKGTKEARVVPIKKKGVGATAVADRGKTQQQKNKAREAEKAAKQKEAERMTAQKAARLAAEKAKAESRPSLFVVSLRYLVSLERIDAAMRKHMAFLNKHYKKGDFLVSGRQVPRTGGIIIARGKDRESVETMMRQDPFVKGKLASLDIVEFSASQMANVLEKWLRWL